MSKIICDICGTSYQDTAECCPICGCSRDAAAALVGEDLLMEEIEESAKGKGGLFSSKKKKDIFDYDEVNPDFEEDSEDEEHEEEEEEEYEDEPRHNTFVVILLTVLITAMLAAAGFLFVRYVLPNMGDEDVQVPSTTVASVEETEEETTEPTIPCERLLLTSGSAELSAEGQMFLLHVTVLPEDTTDEIMYASADESIATVTSDGRITAVAEGETVIYITCGNVQIPCPVVCSFVEETEPPTEETAEQTGSEEESTEETKAAAASDVVLKLKKTDIMLKAPYSCQLELDCALSVEDVEWSVEHSHIATVENGYVTALKSGTTEVIAKYGDQEVRCIVRCY